MACVAAGNNGGDATTKDLERVNEGPMKPR